MRISRFRAVLAAVAMLIMPATILVSAPHASASGDQCVSIGSEPWSLCMSVYGSQGRAQMWLPIIPSPVDPYTWVDECDANGQNCAMVTGSFAMDRASPWVSTNPARTYRGCVDFRDPGHTYPLSVVWGCTGPVTG